MNFSQLLEAGKPDTGRNGVEEINPALSPRVDLSGVNALLDTTPLHRIYVGQRSFSGETDFQALAPISMAACYTSDASRHMNNTARWVKGEIA